MAKRDGSDAAGDTTAPVSIDPLIGQSVDRYRVRCRLGAGGMGVVYRAHDPALDRDVALKLVPPRDEGMAQLEARLRREAQALARLDHPNVVAIHDVGVTAQSLFIAMQLVEGTTLTEHLATARPGPAEVTALFLGAGRGLAAAHAAGIVHRDVKPGNLLVDRGGRVRVGDFGLARSGDDEAGAPDGAATDPDGGSGSGRGLPSLTRTGAVMGTPRYMAPEQHRGAPATARSDQFSFCVAMWEALHGAHPFAATRWDGAAVLDAMMHDRVREPPRVRGVPARVTAALRRGLRGDPAARWPDLDALLAALAPRRTSPLVWTTLGLGGVAGAVALTLALRAPGDPRASCRAAAREMDAVWPAQATALRATIEGAGLPDGPGTADRVVAGLDAYVERWQAQRRDVCEAPRDRAATPALRDMEQRCLDLRRDVVRDVIAELRGAGRAHLDRAIDTVSALPSLDDCTRQALSGQPPPPAADVVAIGLVRRDLARARARLRADDPDGGRRLLDELAGRAEAIGYPPLTAAVYAEQAFQRGDPALVMRAAALAVTSRDDRTAATAYLMALAHASAMSDRSQVATLQSIARASAERAGDADLLARLAAAEGDAASMLGRHDEALAGCEAALPTAPPVERDALYQCLVNGHLRKGDTAGADRWADRELTHLRDRYTPTSLAVAAAMQRRARVRRRQGRYDEALALYREALAMTERIYGADTAASIGLLQDLAQMAHEGGHFDDGIALARRALVIGLEHPHDTGLATTHASLAQLLRKAGRRDEMYVHYRAALARYEAGGRPDDVNLASLRLSFGSALAEDQRLDEALTQIDQAGATFERLHHPRAAVVLQLRGEILQEHGRCAEAVPLFERAVAALTASQADARNLLIAKLNLADCLHQIGEPTRARALAVEIVDVAGRQGDGGKVLVEEAGALLRRLDRARRPPR